MIITKEQGEKLFRFLGYGNPNASYWFIGMEEGTSGDDEIQDNIDVRIRLFDDVMDLHIAHDQQHLKWPICEQSKYPSVWVFMAKIVAALKGKSDWADTMKAKAYICEHLGCAGQETFLAEMLPLPKRSAAKWPTIYETLFVTRELYEKAILAQRTEMLRTTIKSLQPQPKFVFCYGATHYNSFKAIANVPPDQWAMVEGTRIQVCKSGGITFILTPFLGNGRIGTKSLQTLFEYLTK